MKQVTFITGNAHKVAYLRRWLGMPVKHHELDLDELQSLDPRAVAEHKAHQAYGVLHEPVLVEDIAFRITAMGRLPGTFVKWFLQEVGTEGLCKLADGLPSREAEAQVTYAFCDGKDVHFFEAKVTGQVAPEPRGEHGHGWDPIMIPEDAGKTYAEMTPEELEPYSVRYRAIQALREFLQQA